MDTSTLVTTATEAIASPSPSPIPEFVLDDPVPAHHASPVVAFIIGLTIVTLASILNAAGLNLTKLDHVRTSAIPKAARRRDWLRPLWLLGMILYILSQLIGSTLALEYMRAEYVAPLGSTSLIFNFLFAKFLVNTPVTKHDIYGTVIVIVGVIGIVAFGSINSGLGTETNAAHLTYLWTRGNWLAFFFFMAFSVIFLYIFTSQLDLVLSSRSDLTAEPFTTARARTSNSAAPANLIARVVGFWDNVLMWIRERLEMWMAPTTTRELHGHSVSDGLAAVAVWPADVWCSPKPRKPACIVKLISGSLSHENTGNQFGHASAIFTFILLAVTAVAQIICLNRGLKVYDSTLVVPVFYGVYTGVGFLDSLIFNDEVDAYASWTLFLIFVSMIVLVSGVVLLTYKKPDTKGPATTHVPLSARGKRGTGKKGAVGDEEEALRDVEEGESEEIVWQLGDASDEEEEGDRAVLQRRHSGAGRISAKGGEGENEHMMGGHDDDEDGHRESTSSDATLARPDSAAFVDDEEFGAWGSSGGKV
ncbi:hypothetical protein A0H81_12867 [Grifola frondosa]|uniref:Uncharacterized protein n=1 Tax=Grifola frondosa TaxID=5627 RepID=A0A1C7LSM6_GRIFR|nr:hypothetical protein A0H81_12867 [Grifola frondosa]